MPMIAHPLIRDQIDRILLESLPNYSFERFKVAVFVENLVASIPTVKCMVDLASKIGTKGARYGKRPNGKRR